MIINNLADLKFVDQDRFLLLFFVKNHHALRQYVAGVDLLNFELSHLRDVIDTLYMGFIRLQWWRDEIKKIYNDVPFSPHPVLLNLKNIISTYNIPFELFHELITAREADFQEYDSFDITHYACTTHTPLLQIKAKILGEQNDVAALAEGYALIGLMRAIPFYRARSQVILPDIQPQSVQEICNRAAVLLNDDKTTHKYFRAHRFLARLYLKQLEKVGYNPEKLYPLPFKELRLWWGTR
jgi:phytoene/squalene synthetase